MTFKKGSSDPCKQEACDIQSCLKRNNFQEEKCLDTIDKLKDCCRVWYEQSFKTVQSDCCSGFVKEFVEEKLRRKKLEK